MRTLFIAILALCAFACSVAYADGGAVAASGALSAWHFIVSHWAYEAVGLYLLGEVLSKIPSVRANTAFELVWNPVAAWLKKKSPLVGKVADVLDTPETQPEVLK